MQNRANMGLQGMDAMSQGAKFTQQGANAFGQGADWLNKGANAAIGYGRNVENYQGRTLNDAMARFNHQYAEPWQRMQNVANMAQQFAPYGKTYGNTAQTNPYGLTPTGGYLQGMGMGINTFGPMFGNMGTAFGNMLPASRGGTYKGIPESEYSTWM
jgi:hypothetical protein